MSRTRVLLIFGGQSAEHEISVISARSVRDAIDSSCYEVIRVGITRSGEWFLDDDQESLLRQDEVTGEGFTRVRLSDVSSDLTDSDGIQLEQTQFEVVFPLLHGPRGEDGAMQGLLELAGAAYVGAGVAAPAVGMDKELSRAVFATAGLRQTEYLVARRRAWQEKPSSVVHQIEAALKYPLFVKPANLGSSIGISKVHNRESLADAMNFAGGYDLKIMVEESVEPARELECAVLGNEEVQASGIGEIIPGAEFYDYTTKYLDDRSQLIIPAGLPKAVSEAVREMSIRAFQAIDGCGLARVDFLLAPSGDVFLNEINTMPGFTSISMYPKLWQASGMSYPDLIDRLIQLALERHRDRDSIICTR